MSHHTTTAATSAGGSLWWIVDTLYRFGPGWALVPPLLFGSAALVSAYNAALNDAAERAARKCAVVPFVPRLRAHPDE